MGNTSFMPLLPGPLQLEIVVPVSVPCMGQIELFDHLLYLKPFNCVKQMTDVELNYWYNIAILETI